MYPTRRGDIMSMKNEGSILEPSYDPVIRLNKVIELTSCSRAFIYERIKERTFPPGILLGKKSRGWRLSSINKWIEEREAMSHKGNAA